ncbi:MAG: glycosyl hydrolase family 95 catalytic domain-containing protein, partial [Opitutales bacterium]
KQNLLAARAELKSGQFIAAHRAWWHDYYPQSFLTLNDTEKEAFYWIQMYKFASASRGDGPIVDQLGPWYHYTFWPMVWGDLNVQLIYWTHLAANRMSVGESLPNNLDKYAENMAKNVPAHWQDSIALGACFPQDLLSSDHGRTPDMLAWTLHNYWLHCDYAGDRERMRDGLFPLLKKTVNSYRNYLRDNPVPSEDGTIHIRMSWSPEYPGGWGKNINFTIGLLRWSCQTLLDINAEFELNDPLAREWQHILDHLVDFQIDENGLRIGETIAFEKPHRHYSHLLPFFPLSVITPENKADAAMLRQTIDHWLEVTRHSGIKVEAMPVTAYTATGAASMYARLGDPDKAYEYLDFLINHQNISTTTMYAEGNPCTESPLSFAASLHDMLLQSWGGKIRVFAGTPSIWPDVAFHHLRTQGAFLVSAKKEAGVTQFVSVESLIGSPCLIQTDIPNPKILINGKKAKRSQVTKTDDGFYELALKAGDTAMLTPAKWSHVEPRIQALPVAEAKRNLFGLNDKTTRLPGHQFYYPEAAPRATTSAKPIPMPASKGRFVRIELPGNERILSLAEVEVFSEGKNIALKQKTSASSAAYGGVPERAVDGNTDGNFANGSVTCTQEPSANPWWEVDLGRTVEVETIKLFNRSDCCGDRLNGFTIKLLDAKRQDVWLKENVEAGLAIQFGENASN